jgi:hypothetical protein
MPLSATTQQPSRVDGRTTVMKYSRSVRDNQASPGRIGSPSRSLVTGAHWLGEGQIVNSVEPQVWRELVACEWVNR